MSQSNARHCEPLTWGYGPKQLEVFIEPTCPFSSRAFSKFEALLNQAGEDRLTLKIRLLSQPWHTFSPIVTRATLAASTLPQGKEAAKRILKTIFEHREAFILIDHASGPNLEKSPLDLLKLIEQLSGINVQVAFEQTHLETEMKWHAKYSRQNGIHVTPTFMVDGLVLQDMSSGDTIETWLEKLKLN
jgi:protein-disulfide isomerase